MRTVSVENVSRCDDDVLKSSISSHALKPNTPSTHIIIYIWICFIVILTTQKRRFYCISRYKKRLHVPEGSCNRFLYFVLLLLSEQAHFYFVRLILLFTFTASAMAAQQIAKINPKIIIILILSFFKLLSYLCFSVFPICLLLSATVLSALVTSWGWSCCLPLQPLQELHNKSQK